MDGPVSDTARAIQHDPDQEWPTSVVVQVTWHRDGRNYLRTEVIEADAFFGRGRYGAPMSGEALIQAIERMRRDGPPPPLPPTGPPRHVKKAIPNRDGRGKKAKVKARR